MKDNKLYQAKYEYYNNMHGGTLEENNHFLLHGTNLFYIDMIKKNGLDGKYPKELLDIIRKYWSKISYLSEESKWGGYSDWVGLFLGRQERIEQTGTISLSLTGQSHTAEYYGGKNYGTNVLGEGPSTFLKTLDKYIEEHGKDNVDPDMLFAYNYMKEARFYPGIILAIDIRDFKNNIELSTYNISDLNMYEFKLDQKIPPEKLYIRKGDNDYVLLLSNEGNAYIQKMLEQMRIERDKYRLLQIEEEKMHLEQIKKPPVQQIDEWNVDAKTVPKGKLTYFNYKVINETKNIKINIEYNGDDYFILNITNRNNINIILEIQKYPKYDFLFDKDEGVNLLTPEIINQIMTGIKWIFSKIPFEDRREYFHIIVTVFTTNSLLLEALYKYECEELISTQP
jgi:hypothetical protein